jgi:serine/threonine protein kinase
MKDKYLLFPDCSLGEGSFAQIYLGINLLSSQYLAIKVIPLPPSESEGSTLHTLPELIENEILNQSRLWHRHIVKIHDVYKSSKSLYLVMDYCSGGTLEQMLSLRNRLDEEETRVIAYQLLDALCYCHRHGVLHGDIKPANIMFQPQSSSLQEEGEDEEVGLLSPIDLLCEKRRREGKLSTSIHPAPMAVPERPFSSPQDDGKRERLLEDMRSAVLCERCVSKHDFHPATTRRRRHTVSATTPMIGEENENDEGIERLLLSQTLSGEVTSSLSNPHTQVRYRSPYGLLLKLCDFGLSQTIPNIKFFGQTGDILKAPYTTPCGTQGYLSPEIIDQKTYGLAADVWAVGVVLYKCLSGNFPFIPFDAYRHRQVAFKGLVWRKVSRECKELIEVLLTVKEQDRITASQAMNHHWFHEILLISNIIVPSDEIPVSLAKTKEEARQG